MERARVNDVDLAFEIRGEGEPVLLVHGAHIADAMTPLLDEPALEGFRLIHYHRRGVGRSSHPAGSISIETHADDAAGLLGHLGVDRATVVGHSSGGVVALELAARHPSRVTALALLEPALLDVPAGALFAQAMEPIVARYRTGDGPGAVHDFLALVGRPDWRETIDRTVPGGVAQAERDVASFFDCELGGVSAWNLGADRAATITCPILSVLGSESGPLFSQGRPLLHEWFPQCQDADLPGLAHLLQMRDPEAVADALGSFLRAAVPAA